MEKRASVEECCQEHQQKMPRLKICLVILVKDDRDQ
jgi:hypothetical protein